MQHYQSLAAHNSACNEFFYRLQDCQKEHMFGKFFGYCNNVEKEMRKCIKEQRRINREINSGSAKRRLSKVHMIQQEEKSQQTII